MAFFNYFCLYLCSEFIYIFKGEYKEGKREMFLTVLAIKNSNLCLHSGWVNVLWYLVALSMFTARV